jgi:uncharacterized protein YcbK (DUF882 family)
MNRRMEFRRRFNAMGAADLFNSARVTSFVRSAAHNAEVGGAAGSKHLRGEAADIVFPGSPSSWPMARVRAAVQRAGLRLRDERYQTRGTGAHLHIETV